MPLVHGWTIKAHPLFLDQLEKLTAAVETLRRKRPTDFQQSANAKLLATLEMLVFDRIPSDPTLDIYRQGATLGPSRKHWFRAKFGNGRFRLFFRYSSEAKIIIYAWVNDDQTLRTYGARTDAYQVFKHLLATGNPPDSWNELLAAASTPEAEVRFSPADTPTSHPVKPPPPGRHRGGS